MMQTNQNAAMTADPHFTRCGLPGIELIPFGMHACHFYSTRDELVAALVPYFVAGLSGNERCLWITAAPLPANEAIEALRLAWDDADEAIRTGALRVIDFDQWYAASAERKSVDVLQTWLGEEERALAEGYSGIRITGNITFLKPSDWPGFMKYERAVSAEFAGRRIVAFCSYLLAQLSDEQRTEVTEAHNCTFEFRDTTWQVAPKSAAAR